LTKAVVAICVVFVAVGAVGAVGVPLSAGLASGAFASNCVCTALVTPLRYPSSVAVIVVELVIFPLASLIIAIFAVTFPVSTLDIAPERFENHIPSVIPYPANVVGLLVRPANGMLIFAVPSKLTPAIVLAVVSFVADRTFLLASAVLSTLPSHTSVLVSVHRDILPAVAQALRTLPLLVVLVAGT